MSEAVELERAVMICPQCEGEGTYADGIDEDACSTLCTRCGGNGWIVDLSALRTKPAEGEPVAWRWRLTEDRSGAFALTPVWHVGPSEPSPTSGDGWAIEVQPLYTRPVAWPEGYKLVPVEPTEAMIAAGVKAYFHADGSEEDDARGAWTAMLSASDGAGLRDAHLIAGAVNLVREIANMRLEEETEGGLENDDCWETVQSLISEARGLVGDPGYEEVDA